MKYKLPSVEYKGINLTKVIAIPSYGNFFSSIYKSLFTQYDLSNVSSNSDVIIVYSHSASKRADYDLIINTYMEALTNELAELKVLKKIFNIKDKILFFKHLFFSLRDAKNFDIALIYKVKVAFLLARAKVNVDFADEVLKSRQFNVLVTFCDAFDIDNLLAQIAKKYGAITATLQHGQYHILDADVPENLALNNLVSDYLLSWGTATKTENLSKCSNNTSVIPLGICDPEHSMTTPYLFEDKTKKNAIRIMLNADNCFEQNIKMIKLALSFCRQNKLLFTIQFHPKNNKKKYLTTFADDTNYRSEINSSEICFSITYTSGALVKLLSKGEYFTLFKDEFTPNIFIDSLPCFEDQNGLESYFHSLSDITNAHVNAMTKAQSYFIANGDALINNRLFIQKILGEIKNVN